MEAGTLQAHKFGMAKPHVARPRPKPPRRRRIFLKEWRTHRGLTQEQLAERVGMSVSNISQLEQGRQGYSQEGLEALADALQCDPGQLLMVDPSRSDAIWSIWEGAATAERQMIVDIAKTITSRKTGT
jgi:transcriptional regulator with XRE-family HTH domain